MPMVNDWIAKAAKRIASERRPTSERIAAIIAVHSRSLVKFIQSQKREHHHSSDHWYCCPRCPMHDSEPDPDAVCDCEEDVDVWNEKIDRLLDGVKL